MNIQQNIKDYTTLTKPKVNLLLVITALSAIFLASNNLPSIQVLVAVVVGGTLASVLLDLACEQSLQKF